MAYVLKAVIASELDMEHCGCQAAVSEIDLPQSYCMIPLVNDLLRSIYDQSTPQPYIPGFMYLKTSVLDWLTNNFRSGTLAVVENDTWGGVGEQSALIWEDGKVIFGPIHTVTNICEPYTDQNVPPDNAAINQALRLLGVVKEAKDEFSALGLGKHRDTGDWVH